jgi:hypothetical protein
MTALAVEWSYPDARLMPSLELLGFEEPADAKRQLPDLASAGVCEPGELRAWRMIAGRLDAAVRAKRERADKQDRKS